MSRFSPIWLLLAGVAGTGAAKDLDRTPFSEHRAAFTLRAHEETIPYDEFAVYVVPEESFDVSVVEPSRREEARLTASWGVSHPPGSGTWHVRAPASSGVHTLWVDSGADRIVLHVLVMVPATAVRDGVLRGYRIGAYPSEPLRGLESYLPPGGFIEVTPQNASLRLSPHFTLGQFLCKQGGGYPKFVVLRERMLLKLEFLLAVANERGLRADTFFVMSGYRTPQYNRAIGNVRYSRHQYGDAADIFIDEDPRDGVMDDLDGDGRVTDADAHLLYDLIESEASLGSTEYEDLVGGLGSYGRTPSHGPFVHVDARGYIARWGR